MGGLHPLAVVRGYLLGGVGDIGGLLVATEVDQGVGRAAQQQANDMYAENYDTDIDPVDGGDVGDRLVAQNYQWDDYAALLDKGDRTLDQQASIFVGETCTGTQLCINDPNFQDFGFAKAGAGADTRWVLVLADPSN